MSQNFVQKMIQRSRNRQQSNSNRDLTQGPISTTILQFAFPMFMGQLLQQLYNMADAWVVGNFAETEAFAAVSSSGSLIFLIIGFFNGISIGGGVIISRYFGAKDKKKVQQAIHANVLFALLASILATVVGLMIVPQLLEWMNTPAEVMPHALSYYRIYFAGVSTVILYNIFMSIMRSLGDSVHPLYYLMFSSVVNVILDLLFVAVFHWGVGGAAIATVISQGLSVVLCVRKMLQEPDEDLRLSVKKLGFYGDIMKQVLRQGLPTGIQNSVISVGNIVIQSNINAFGAAAMAGHGAFAKVEGFVFLPIMSISMALSTFISQNLGARQYDRAKKGAAFGIFSCMLVAEAIGVLFYLYAPTALRIFVSDPQSLEFGRIHSQTTALFFFLLAFSHSAAGVMRGCGKAFIPMITMLAFWCGVRIIYVTLAVKIWPVFQTISWAYPLTWSLSSILFLICLLRTDWTKAFESKKKS